MSKLITQCNLFYICFLFLITIKVSNNYVIIPFKSTSPKYNLIYDNSPDFIDKFKNEMDKNKFYTIMLFGEPKKDLVFYFTMKDYFVVMNNSCSRGMISSYIPYESKTFNYDPKSSCTYYDLFNAKLGNDSCSIYNDRDMYEPVITHFNFLVDNQTYVRKNYDYEPNKFCGKIGLIIRGSYPYYYSNFIDNLKKNNIIQSYQWGLFFFDKEQSYNINKEIQNKYDGCFIVGINENDYLNIFNTNIISNTYQELPLFTMLGGKFNTIYFRYLKNKIVCSEDRFFEIDIEKNYITCTRDYYNNIKKYFFNKYFEDKICKEIISDDKYSKGDSMVMCDLSFKNELNNFPKLFLFYRELNFTFILDYNDLFIELDNKIYFLIISPETINSVWNFGNILIKKFPFMFDQDKKQIYFIHLKKYKLKAENENNEETNNSQENQSFWYENKIYILFILCFIFIIIALIIGFIFGRKIWERNRKIRANELDDNFEYTKEIDEEKFTNIIN